MNPTKKELEKLRSELAAHKAEPNYMEVPETLSKCSKALLQLAGIPNGRSLPLPSPLLPPLW